MMQDSYYSWHIWMRIVGWIHGWLFKVALLEILSSCRSGWLWCFSHIWFHDDVLKGWVDIYVQTYLLQDSFQVSDMKMVVRKVHLKYMRTCAGLRIGQRSNGTGSGGAYHALLALCRGRTEREYNCWSRCLWSYIMYDSCWWLLWSYLDVWSHDSWCNWVSLSIVVIWWNLFWSYDECWNILVMYFIIKVM